MGSWAGLSAFRALLQCPKSVWIFKKDFQNTYSRVSGGFGSLSTVGPLAFREGYRERAALLKRYIWPVQGPANSGPILGCPAESMDCSPCENY